MDRPTARRRRHAGSANSVTVAELQAKTTPSEQESVSAIQARAAAEASTPVQPRGRPTVTGVTWAPATAYRPASAVDPDTEPVRADDGPDEHRTSNRLAKTIIVTLTIMVGVGAVTAFAVLTGGRPHRLSPSAPMVQPAVISGPAVVRPDAIIQQLETGAVDSVPSGTPGEPTAQGQRTGLLADRDSAAKLVTDFYASLPVRTSEAFALLAPDMQVDGWAAFDVGWRGTVAVESRIRPSPAGEDGLRVLVSIQRIDGTVLRLLQQIEVRAVRVDGRPQLRIVGVQLLSAHRV